MKSIPTVNIADKEQTNHLKAGDWISYTGKVITIRDASQSKLIQTKEKTKKLPFDLEGRVVLYAAPAMSKEVIIGPTTSTRMDGGLDFLLKHGVTATIGKGKRNKNAIDLIKKYQAPYFILMSGVSAYLSDFFKKEKIVAFKELGPEAVYEFTTSGLLLITAIDTKGRSIFNQ